MKKLLLSLGALSAVVAPVAAVVACGSKTETPAKHDINLTTEATSTLTKTDLAKVTLGTNENPASLQRKLGLDQTPMSATGATYTWDKTALTLTTTSEVEGIKSVQVITVTPKALTAAEVALNELNENITKALATDVAKSMEHSQTPRQLGNKLLKSAEDWKQTLKVVKGGFLGKAGEHGSTYYSAEAKDGYTKTNDFLILWTSVANTAPNTIAAWKFDAKGIESLFSDVMHGGWSLSIENLKEGGINTGYVETYKVITSIKDITKLG